MKIGDLVYFKVAPSGCSGALTAVKYYARIKKLTDDRAGVILSVHGDSYYVAFGTDAIMLNKLFLEIANESGRLSKT
tara:strand:- start:106 stop:336 length:231 start_codon:yes stop_codon:yes gene_type:complete